MDGAHSIVVLECGNDDCHKSMHPPEVKDAYGNGQLWPDIKRLLDWTRVRTKKSQT